MGEKDGCAKLQDKARRLGEELGDLVGQIKEQQKWQREQLEGWVGQMADLLTFLVNYELYLEIDDGLDGEGPGPADFGGSG